MRMSKGFRVADADRPCHPLSDTSCFLHVKTSVRYQVERTHRTTVTGSWKKKTGEEGGGGI